MSSRPSPAQLNYLADFLGENPGIAKGLLRSAFGRNQTKKKWNEAAKKLNSLDGAHKDGKGWAKFWADKKFALKKACAQHAMTGDMYALSPIDSRLVEAIGGYPFPSTSKETADASPDSPVSESPISIHPLKVEVTGRETSSYREASPLHTKPNRTEQTNQRRLRFTRSRMSLDSYLQRFSAIERQRAQAEALTARSLNNAVQHLKDLKSSVDGLSAAIKEMAEIQANALNNIAYALNK